MGWRTTGAIVSDQLEAVLARKMKFNETRPARVEGKVVDDEG